MLPYRVHGVGENSVGALVRLGDEPIGFGAILMNLPGADLEILHLLYEKGIANELFPLILFIGIGAMIDFGPLLSNPKLMIFGAAAQFGIFFTLFLK